MPGVEAISECPAPRRITNLPSTSASKRGRRIWSPTFFVFLLFVNQFFGGGPPPLAPSIPPGGAEPPYHSLKRLQRTRTFMRTPTSTANTHWTTASNRITTARVTCTQHAVTSSTAIATIIMMASRAAGRNPTRAAPRAPKTTRPVMPNTAQEA